MTRLGRSRFPVTRDDIADGLVFSAVVLLLTAGLFFAAVAVLDLVAGPGEPPAPKTTVVSQSLGDGRAVECVVLDNSKAISCDWENSDLP